MNIKNIICKQFNKNNYNEIKKKTQQIITPNIPFQNTYHIQLNFIFIDKFFVCQKKKIKKNKWENLYDYLNSAIMA